ncbi:hypothetical protein [Anthocerotibacter panamensis]|uniref:hypothetical protein n=1 Tax=Anthocerotibacter panamensis TaxID=2857077 RepID=UPI001C405528|nr:hypothetical protein [Anthocerotibacter panamensis]
MQDSLLLCQISVGPFTLQGYRVDQYYAIVVQGLREKALHYFFNEFEDMNQLWMDLKGASETEIAQRLAGRPEGLQGPSKPRPRTAAPMETRPPLDRGGERPRPQPRPRPMEERPPLPKPRRPAP